MREIGEARPEYGSIQERSGEFVGMTGKKIQRARTKTVATVGPASNSPEQLNQLIQCGVDVFRINTAHGTADEHDQIFHAIRAASRLGGAAADDGDALVHRRRRRQRVPAGMAR